MTQEERFEQKYIPEPMTGCWLWIGASVPKGYGCAHYNKKNEAAHRVSWRIHRGDIPRGAFVCHKCDTPACVNPDHLFLGDAKSNAEDCVNKKRYHGQKKTHCKKGHLLAGDNLYIAPGSTMRNCKACCRRRAHASQRKIRGSVKSYAKRSRHWDEGK